MTIARYVEACALRFLLDAPSFVGSSTTFETLTGSTYVVRRGRVTGGAAGDGKTYDHIELVDFIYRGQVTTKLGFSRGGRRLFLTSPITGARLVFTA